MWRPCADIVPALHAEYDHFGIMAISKMLLTTLSAPFASPIRIVQPRFMRSSGLARMVAFSFDTAREPPMKTFITRLLGCQREKVNCFRMAQVFERVHNAGDCRP